MLDEPVRLSGALEKQKSRVEQSCVVLVVESQPSGDQVFADNIKLSVSGVSEMVYAFQVRPAKGWVAVLISGMLALLLGILIWRQWPLSGTWAIGVLVGVKLLVYGAALAVLGIAALTMVHEEKEAGVYTPLA